MYSYRILSNKSGWTWSNYMGLSNLGLEFGDSRNLKYKAEAGFFNGPLLAWR